MDAPRHRARRWVLPLLLGCGALVQLGLAGGLYAEHETALWPSATGQPLTVSDTGMLFFAWLGLLNGVLMAWLAVPRPGRRRWPAALVVCVVVLCMTAVKLHTWQPPIA